MKKLLTVMLFIPSLALANVNLEFQNAGLVELLQTVIKGVWKKDYVLSPDVLADQRKVTVSLKNKSDADLMQFFKTFLQQHDIEIKDAGNLIYVSKNKPDPIAPGLPFLQSGQLPQVVQKQSIDSLIKPVEQPGQSKPELTQIRRYNPKYKSLEFLASFIKFTGHQVLEGQGDTLIFISDDATFSGLSALLSSVDKPSGELMVKAYLYEVSKAEKEGGGFNAAINLLNGKLGLSLTGAALANTLNLNLTNVQAVFSAFQSDSRFHVISSPSLRVLDGKQARFSVGSDVPVLGAVVQNNTTTQQSVNYRSSGVILDIKPTIREERIDLEISQQMSNFQPTSNGVNNSPTLIKRELSSTVSVKDGDLIMLGGLDETKEGRGASGLSWLPSFLWSTDYDTTKTDILLVLHVQKI